MTADNSRSSTVPAEQPANLISISVAPAELIDKVTILELKRERISDPMKLTNVLRELAILCNEEDRSIAKDETIRALRRRLKEVNTRIWDLEDRIRECERSGDFGPHFVATARSIYRSNDQRAEAKKEINLHLGSVIIEEKSYTAY